jgi:hypothetical protein
LSKANLQDSLPHQYRESKIFSCQDVSLKSRQAPSKTILVNACLKIERDAKAIRFKAKDTVRISRKERFERGGSHLRDRFTNDHGLRRYPTSLGQNFASKVRPYGRLMKDNLLSRGRYKGCDQNGPPARRDEGAYLDRYVTEEQRSRRPIFIATPLHQSLTWCSSEQRTISLQGELAEKRAHGLWRLFSSEDYDSKYLPESMFAGAQCVLGSASFGRCG